MAVGRQSQVQTQRVLVRCPQAESAEPAYIAGVQRVFTHKSDKLEGAIVAVEFFT